MTVLTIDLPELYESSYNLVKGFSPITMGESFKFYREVLFTEILSNNPTILTIIGDRTDSMDVDFSMYDSEFDINTYLSSTNYNVPNTNDIITMKIYGNNVNSVLFVRKIKIMLIKQFGKSNIKTAA